jgi:hypothetical protein
MAFQQLYYTSCEAGLAGYGGYQFNAVTSGTSPLVMREVEGRSVYEPPRWLLADPCPDEPEAYPVAFSYAKSEATDAVILTHVMFIGNDYSGRPGNYFAHALVTSTPEQDLAPLLPAELWGAPLWQNTAIEANTLPVLPGPLPRGDIDRAGVQRFLEARGTGGILPELLTAVWQAMAGNRKVLLSGNDANENIWWIAAVSYLLGDRFTPAMTFTTYSHRPGYSSHHLIGTQTDSVPPDAEAGFQLFDLDSGKTPGGIPHPLAALLAEAGVMATEGLWQRAAVFASGTEERPDDWLGPVSAASGLLRGRLTGSEAKAVAGWLPGTASRIPPQHAAVALGLVLDQPDTAIAGEHVLILLGVARRIGTPSQVDRLERLLAERAVAQLGRGAAAEPVRLSAQGTEVARAAVSDLLLTAEPGIALASLAWAAASGAMPADAVLEEYGGVRLPGYGREPESVQILQYYPAALRGFLAWLAREQTLVVRQALTGPVGTFVSDHDLAAYPRLAEERLLLLVETRRMAPQHAFDRIRDIRAAAKQPPYVDATLLSRLWPAGCPPEQIAELVDVMADPAAPDVHDWFVRQIQAAATQSTRSQGWLALARTFTDNPSLLQQLPADLASVVQQKASSSQTWHRAMARVEMGDQTALGDLYAAHNAMPRGTARSSSAAELAALISEVDPLAPALRDCPPDVIRPFCHKAMVLLDAGRPHPEFAARVFAALARPVLEPSVSERLAAEFERVSDWKKRDLNHIAQCLEGDKEVLGVFQQWREDHSNSRLRKWFGGSPGAVEDH